MKVEGLVDLQEQQKASTKPEHHSLSDGQLEASIAELGSLECSKDNSTAGSSFRSKIQMCSSQCTDANKG